MGHVTAIVGNVFNDTGYHAVWVFEFRPGLEPMHVPIGRRIQPQQPCEDGCDDGPTGTGQFAVPMLFGFLQGVEPKRGFGDALVGENGMGIDDPFASFRMCTTFSPLTNWYV